MFRIWLRNLFPRTLTKNRFLRRPHFPLRFLQLEDRTNPVGISIATPLAQVEGNAGTTTMTFTVTLDAPAPVGGLTVDFATADGTANAVIDYVANANTLTFNAGDTSKTISVTINGDLTVEADETFTVNLSNPSAGNAILVGTATGTITNDDSAEFKISKNAAAVEGSPITFTVSLTNPVDVTTSVTVTTADGTTSPTDYTGMVAQVVTFTPGVVSQLVTVSTTADAIVEADETFTATLGGLSNGGRGTVTISATDNVGTGTIVNDDQTTLTIANVAQLENVATMKFAVTSSNAVQGGFKVDFATVAGTAQNNIDYTFATGTLTFAGTAGRSSERRLGL